ncbi:NifU family protein [Candidatus Uhrbacteria bacterium]|nr:NifU family protein [Candidatus Uhrbacteria bacterium]
MPFIEQQIEKVLDQIRPALRSDGGDIELVKFDEKTGAAHVRFIGACIGCPFADFTLSMTVEEALKNSIPEITEIILINEIEHEPDL